MTVGRFFANFSVVSGTILRTANSLFAQQSWGYDLVGEKPVPTTDELKNLVDGGWFGWSGWPWVVAALVIAVIALLLHFRRRRREPEIVVNPAPPPSTGDGKVLGDIAPPPPSTPPATPQPPPPSDQPTTKLEWNFKRGVLRTGKNPEPDQPPAAPTAVAAVVVDQKSGQETAPVTPPPSLCPKCGMQVKGGCKFCTTCGTKLPVFVPVEDSAPPEREMEKCSNCQAEMPVGSKFCTACGKKFVDNFPTPATVVVNSVLALVFVFSAVVNAAPTIDHCTPPLLAWDGQARNFDCFGTDLAGLANSKVTNIPEVTGIVVRSSATAITLQLTAVRNINATYNSADFAINGNKIGKPIVLVSPQEAGRQSFFHNAYMREVKAMITTAMATGDRKARKDAAEALALAKKALTASAGGGKVDSKLLERLAKLEEEMRQQPVEATIRTMVRQEADSVANGLRSEIEGAKKQVDETATAVRNEMRTSKDQSNASVRSLEGRVGALEASTARDRAVIQATACAVLSDDGGWLGQGPSNRRKRAIRDASVQAGYQPCPKK